MILVLRMDGVPACDPPEIREAMNEFFAGIGLRSVSIQVLLRALC